MYEVTKNNYHQFLTFHGMCPETASIVVATWDNTEAYRTNGSVRTWVEASKFVLGINK